jgi:hypothetical protein
MEVLNVNLIYLSCYWAGVKHPRACEMCNLRVKFGKKTKINYNVASIGLQLAPSG